MPERAVAFANDAFYDAFRRADPEAMAALWAVSAPVSCIHPGGSVLRGRDAVLASWHAIFAGASSAEIDCRGAQVALQGEVAVVTCYEVIRGGTLAATNLYVHEAGVWRMVHHQAGPTAAAPPPPEPAPDARMH